MNGDAALTDRSDPPTPRQPASIPDGFIPLFVGGAPRSGTTVLHALICTANNTNGYIEECSYFGGFMHPFLRGLETFDIHTKYYFSTREKFFDYHASILARLLSDIWRTVGSPEILALKDPLLTPCFHHLARMLKRARFVVITRNPYDTISSRIEVMRRLNDGREPKTGEIRAVCLEYANWYRAILDNRDALGDRLCIVSYEKLVMGEEYSILEALGIGEIQPDNVWSNAITNIRDNVGGGWFSTLYGQKLTNASVGRHRRILTPKIKAMVDDICGDVSRQLGVPVEQSVPDEWSMPKERWRRLWRRWTPL
jgi:Sulfotransferase family